MQDWFTPEHEARELAEFRRIKAKHPQAVTLPFECNLGWYGLLEDYFDEVAKLLGEHPGATYELRQVKEKFAGLRIYARTSCDIRDAVTAAYDRAARLSEETCEVCGKPGALRVRLHSYMTRCEEHADGGEPTEPFKYKDG